VSRKIGRLDEDQVRLIQKRRRERSLILKQLKSRGPSTIPELAEATGFRTDEVLQHMISLMQFRQVAIVGEKGDHPLYDLSEKE